MTFANGDNQTRHNILATIVEHDANRPRSKQTEVGCSSLGTACQRQLAYRILGVAGRHKHRFSWLAMIGTSVHAYLETIFSQHPDRYLAEQAVKVSSGEVSIPGTVDLYDKHTRTVIDFKVVGDTTLNKARRGIVSPQYITQVNLYGLGLKQAGHQVENVAILFLPKTKELTDAAYVEKPFDETLASTAMARYAAIRVATKAGATAKDFTPTDAPCMWCEWFDPNATDLNTGCPGVLPNLNQLT